MRDRWLTVLMAASLGLVLPARGDIVVYHSTDPQGTTQDSPAEIPGDIEIFFDGGSTPSTQACTTDPNGDGEDSLVAGLQIVVEF